MNRRSRRIQARSTGLAWGKVVAQGSYAELGESDARQLLMQVFRAVASEVSDETFNDETLFNSTMVLIRNGLLDIWFALDGTDVRVKYQVAPIGGAP